jgi:hypothetical protein
VKIDEFIPLELQSDLFIEAEKSKSESSTSYNKDSRSKSRTSTRTPTIRESLEGLNLNKNLFMFN